MSFEQVPLDPVGFNTENKSETPAMDAIGQLYNKYGGNPRISQEKFDQIMEGAQVTPEEITLLSKNGYDIQAMSPEQKQALYDLEDRIGNYIMQNKI